MPQNEIFINKITDKAGFSAFLTKISDMYTKILLPTNLYAFALPFMV
jgi:hypothetical protein